MLKIIKRGLYWFNKYGLGKPISFRAGGWFANTETLKALEDMGFLIDTSGRTEYTLNNTIKGPWYLKSTTHPYHPSKTDQNSESLDSSQNFRIWEFSNNGGDSYWYKTEELIKRFEDNFKGKPLMEKQQITYLSHPHWFTREQEQINSVFDHINQFLYQKDEGPVRYVTLANLYQAWAE